VSRDRGKEQRKNEFPIYGIANPARNAKFLLPLAHFFLYESREKQGEREKWGKGE
jgi:hypothetical protein